jgi:hypothetical protein
MCHARFHHHYGFAWVAQYPETQQLDRNNFKLTPQSDERRAGQEDPESFKKD